MAPLPNNACKTQQEHQHRHGGQTRHLRFAPTPAPDLAGRAERPRLDRLTGLKAREFVGQRLRRGIAALAFFLQAPQADRFQVAQHAGIEQARRQRLGVQHEVQRLGQGLGLERRAARQQVIERRAQRIHVRAPGDAAFHCGAGILACRCAGHPWRARQPSQGR
ncbi:MAG: hypothetical protein HY674_03285 [Chloroflexi bacterium]|nr:hypothetical protein [Chloroflexota bacterium]